MEVGSDCTGVSNEGVGQGVAVGPEMPNSDHLEYISSHVIL